MSNPAHGLSPEIIEQLKEPMELSRVKTRKAPGGGVVPYIDGADAISTANRIFNFDWSSHVGEIRFQPADERSEVRWNPETQKREATGEKKQTGIYYVTVGVTACGVTKTDVGRCVCDGNAVEAHDMAIAGAVTDGLKRALRQFGDQFGNALYDKESDTFREAMQGQQPAWGARAPTPSSGSAREPARSPTPKPTPAPAARPAPAPAGANGTNGSAQTRPAPGTPPAAGTNRVRPAPGRSVEPTVRPGPDGIVPNPRRSSTQLPLDE